MADHTETTRFKKPEEIKAFLDSEEFITGFKEYASNGVRDWITSNPESTRVGHSILRGLSAFTEISHHLWPFIRVLLADAEAEKRIRKYQEHDIPIPFGKAVVLASLLIAFRLPYSGSDHQDDGDLTYVRDYEMLSVHSLKKNELPKLIEDSRSSPVAYRALQESLKHLQETQKPIPSELREWAYDAATGKTATS